MFTFFLQKNFLCGKLFLDFSIPSNFATHSKENVCGCFKKISGDIIFNIMEKLLKNLEKIWKN